MCVLTNMSRCFLEENLEGVVSWFSPNTGLGVGEECSFLLLFILYTSLFLEFSYAKHVLFLHFFLKKQ